MGGAQAGERIGPQGSLFLLAGALAASVLLHASLAVLCLVGTKQPSKDEQSLLVRLISHRVLSQRQVKPAGESEPSARQPAKRAGGGGMTEASGSKEAGSMVRLKDNAAATPLLEAVDDEAVRNALKRIQKKIIPRWSRAEPPGMGRVEVRMELDGQGRISSLWITSLQGPTELGDFIAGLIRQSSPFPAAVKHIDRDRLVLDCSFNVTGSTVQTKAAGPSKGDR